MTKRYTVLSGAFGECKAVFKIIWPPLFFITLWLALPGIADAQSISFYQEAAANYTNIRVVEPFPYPYQERDDIGNKSNFGFEAGFTVQFNTKLERLSLPIGIHFQRKGFHLKPVGPVYVLGADGSLSVLQTDRIGYRFDYLTISPSVKYFFVKDLLGFSLGPYAALRVKEAVKIYDHTGWEDEDGDTFINKTDLGLQAGLYAHLGRFGLFAKYQHGLLKNDKFETADENFLPTGYLNFRNQALVLGLSYRLTKN